MHACMHDPATLDRFRLRSVLPVKCSCLPPSRNLLFQRLNHLFLFHCDVFCFVDVLSMFCLCTFHQINLLGMHLHIKFPQKSTHISYLCKQNNWSDRYIRRSSEIDRKIYILIMLSSHLLTAHRS